jgi:glycosyltransferase involved in cell wall biosynthesis
MTNTFSPTVSVVITTYNHGALVLDAIRSVLAQTFTPLEIVIVDDGSTDGTGGRIEKAFGSSVRYIHQANSGIAGSRNRGVSEARGDLVALMDGDDLWHSRKLELQAAAYAAHPDSGVVAVRSIVFDSAGPAPDPSSVVPALPSVSSRQRLEDLLEYNFLATTSEVAIPKRVLDAVGPSDSRYRVCSDFDLYCRIASRYPITVVEAPLTFWRYHSTSASGHRDLRRLNWGPESLAIVRANRDSAPPELRSTFALALRRKVKELGWEAFDYGTTFERGPAARILRKLLRQFPGELKLWMYAVAVSLPVPHSFWRLARGTRAS